MDKAQVFAALQAAQAAPFTRSTISGCGRAYVCLPSKDRSFVNAVSEACRKLGLIFERKGHYGTGRNSIYIGYDNADGIALGRSKAFAASLQASGIDCYDDAVAD